jgi:PAS domain S-box-containing protein
MPATPHNPATTTTEMPVKVLVVDDLAEKLLVYKSILDEPSLEVMSARSGSEALSRILEHDFAVILMDVNMPGMDGFETATLIRSRRRSAHTPIIFITAHADEMHAHRGYAHGAVDYIITPVVPEILRTKVNVFAELFRLRRRAEADAAERIARAEHEQSRASERAAESRALLAAIVESTEDAVLGKSLEGVITSCNPAAERLFGYTAAELIGQSMTRLIPKDRLEEEQEFLRRLRSGQSPGRQVETIRITKAGQRLDMALTISPVFGPNGNVIGASTIARDISERKLAEQELRRHREHLEQLVAERTAELEASHQRMRMTDRLASIGTLAAGLGHDMGNLLMPLRMRLDALEEMDLPPQAREDLEAIASAGEYLRRLSHGLRLFALNPEDTEASGDHTDLGPWWDEVGPFLRNAVRKEITVEADLPASLPAVRMSPHVLTQSVYNLVKNAGDALADRRTGNVRISAGIGAHEPSGARTVVLSVTDDGPGMTEEVRRRCLEPFFTTKTRAISTGLGLALVCGAMRSAGGRVEIDSVRGRGTTFRLTLRVWEELSESGVSLNGTSATAPASRARSAWVNLPDARVQAFVVSMLGTLGVDIPARDPLPAGRGSLGNAPGAQLLVLGDNADPAQISSFLDADPAHRVIVFAHEPAEPAAAHAHAAYVGNRPVASVIRAALLAAVRPPTSVEIDDFEGVRT